MKNLNFPYNLFDLKNKTIVLTGSAGRLGSRFANVLSSAGGKVVLVDVDSRKNKKLQTEIERKYKYMPLMYNVDFSNEESVELFVEDILKKEKHIDVLINNAHFVPRAHPHRDASFEDYPFDLWNKTISVNLGGLFLCCKKVGKVMTKQKKGVIVNVSSIYGINGADQRIYGTSRLNSPAFYSASKGAMVNLTKYLAAYWHGKNIRVNTLTLGGVFDKKLHTNKQFVKKYSDKTILGRMGNKKDYDGALLFLSSSASSYMTGSNLIIDGGWSSW
jgi:NAD(P)-dependent dehydrogenase (short-subunit alcohol dehydrogenase family)